MLTDLRIRNLAIVEDLSLAFTPGLNLLTGETGAGKSIVVEALSLVTGGRADATLVRTGAKGAFVEAVFEDIGGDAVELARSFGAEVEDGRLILAREIAADGKSRAFLDGRSVPVSSLREVAGPLIDLHLQHQSRSLLKPETHLAAVDRFGGCDELRQRVALACSAARGAEADYRRMLADLRQRETKLDLLRFQDAELATLDPVAGEEEVLRAEASRLTHAGRIAELSAAIVDALAEDEGSAQERIVRSMGLLDELSRCDSGMAASSDRLREARFALEDVVSIVRSGREAEADPARLDQLESRLALLESFQRKYGGDAAMLVDRHRDIRREIAELTDAEGSLEAKQRAFASALREYRARAEELSSRRQKAAGQFASALAGELKSLAFGAIEVRVPLTRLVDEAGPLAHDGEPFVLSPAGWDHAEVLFSANPGEEPRPLARIASGGELSRFMLAMNALLDLRLKAVSIVFDEVDAGIGGSTADAVGERLSALAENRQILCITHLPQIASRKGTHWTIDKSERDGRTHVSAIRLENDARVDEIARMLGSGSSSSAAATARDHARELLARGGTGTAPVRRRRSA